MTTSPLLWALSLWMIGTAIGSVVYWVRWFRMPHDQEWLPAGYVGHERALLYPNVVMDILLVTAAVMTIFQRPNANDVGLLAAGMMGLLAIVDIAYLFDHDLFRTERGGRVNAAMVVALLALTCMLIAVPLS